MPRRKTAQLDREVAKALKKPAMTLRRADEVIRAANLEGFGGRCGRVAIAINRVVFGDKGRYVIATNPHISRHRGQLFMGHVVVEWKGRLFDATGGIDDEHGVEAWGMVDHNDSDYDYLTEDEANDGQLHYIDDLYPSRSAQERAIEAGTRGQCPLGDVERALREAMAS
ncbi:MAG TPA: hypothetical protein VLE97_11670 [Gaiellaceae bacterium]|nr:hypothetical protein [Gaiellaceae bacterium]